MAYAVHFRPEGVHNDLPSKLLPTANPGTVEGPLACVGADVGLEVRALVVNFA